MSALEFYVPIETTDKVNVIRVDVAYEKDARH
jgi:hypothetical protein